MAPIASAATSVLKWRPGCAGAYRCGGAAAAAAAAAGLSLSMMFAFVLCWVFKMAHQSVR